jgi:hypothetical protein
MSSTRVHSCTKCGMPRLPGRACNTCRVFTLVQARMEQRRAPWRAVIDREANRQQVLRWRTQGVIR